MCFNASPPAFHHLSTREGVTIFILGGGFGRFGVQSGSLLSQSSASAVFLSNPGLGSALESGWRSLDLNFWGLPWIILIRISRGISFGASPAWLRLPRSESWW